MSSQCLLSTFKPILHRVWHLSSCSQDSCPISMHYVHTGEKKEGTKGPGQTAESRC